MRDVQGLKLRETPATSLLMLVSPVRTSSSSSSLNLPIALHGAAFSVHTATMIDFLKSYNLITGQLARRVIVFIICVGAQMKTEIGDE